MHLIILILRLINIIIIIIMIISIISIIILIIMSFHKDLRYYSKKSITEVDDELAEVS